MTTIFHRILHPVVVSFRIGVLLIVTTHLEMAQVKPNTATAPPVKTPVTAPAAYPSTAQVNYIRSWEPSMPTTDPAAVISTSRTTAEVKQTTQYFDGLGRPLQTVTKRITSGGRDLVSPVVYDEFGREAYQYLSYPQTTVNTNDGKFKLNPFSNQATAISSLGLYPGENIYYGKTDFEASPLSRVLNAMAPGNSWTGSSKGISQSYETNTAADGVRIWTIAAAAGSLPVSTAGYAAGGLYKNITTDEAGNRVVEFRDLTNHVVLKRVAMSTTATDGHTGWLCTYYVYDDLDNLRFVIQPRAVEYLAAHSWVLTQAIADELCFRYEYDGRRRMIIKKVPGAGEVQMVYDQRDRLVFSQDGEQRVLSPTHQWNVVYYDGLNRPVETGLYASNSTRPSLQTTMDGVIGSSSAVTYSIPAPGDLSVNSRGNNTPATYTARSSITFLPGFQSGTSDVFTASIDPNAVESSGTLLPVDAANPLPPIASGSVTPLSYTFYDDYTWSGHQTFQSNLLSKTTTGGNAYGESPTSYSIKTRGMVTGSRVRIVNSNPEQWLTTTTYYDDKGRVLQVISTNTTAGTDVVTNKYDFSGKLLSHYIVTHNNRSTVTPEVRVLTENLYDAAGRLTSVTKTLNDDVATKRVIATNRYNELGQLLKKSIGKTPASPLDTLHYDYNIRGWLTGINKPYVNNASTLSPAPGRFFGMELDYDYGFTQSQYNGNIAGERWRTSGDGQRRAYGFTYDAASRLTKGDFTQYTGGWNTTAGVNYSVSGLTYDANGNIKTMKRLGLITTTSGTVDNLIYGYHGSNYSNKLDSVTDNGGTAAALGDFKNGHTGAVDYTYDANGNLSEDLNKAISLITYNHLNLPENITFTGKGSIKFVYNAAGNKVKKIVTDNTAVPTKTTTTDYINGFVYQNDTLQFFPTEEGRVRYLPAHGSTAASFVYDYFIKDHLGNTRVVLTEQTDFTNYLATMEPESAQQEDALFYNVDNTREAKPADYPPDETTSPNTAIAKLNGKDPDKRIGPSIILKVMAGDTIQAGVRAFYREPATKKNNPDLPAEEMLGGLLQALVMPGQAALQGHVTNLQASRAAPRMGITGSDLQSLKQKDPQAKREDKPKAYLNYVFFDNQLNFVDDGSGVKQIEGEPGQLETLVSGNVVAKKNGYVYVYTSNESQQDVLFDNLGVTQITGPVLEETHYYPFGLTMAGISTTAPLKLGNRFKFNGKELNHHEFSDMSGLDWYSYGMREYDPQIGRFFRVDPLANKFPWWTPYQFAGDVPTKYVDLDGMETAYYDPETNTIVPAGDHLTHRVSEGDLIYLPNGAGHHPSDPITGLGENLVMPILGQAIEDMNIILFGRNGENNKVGKTDRGFATLDLMLLGAAGDEGKEPGMRVPNPKGRLGGDLHQAKVKEIAEQLKQEGYEITGGGGREKEEYLPSLTGGRKGSNYVDVTAIKDGSTVRVQVGKQNKNGTPVSRERKNLEMIRQKKPDDQLWYLPYNY